MKRIILIPAYEPDDKLLEIVNKIDKNYEIVAVDDGSTDKTIFNKIEPSVHLVSYKTNRGKGYALKQGFKYIKTHFKNYIVVCVDADLQHDLSDAYKLCDYVEKNDNVFVIGRRHWGIDDPLSNRIGNAITRRVFKRKTGLSIYDTQSGLRAFSYKLIDYLLSIRGDRYEYEMNVLLNLKKNKIPFHEIDIKTIYIDKNQTSHFRAIKDSYRIYKDIAKFK